MSVKNTFILIVAGALLTACASPSGTPGGEAVFDIKTSGDGNELAVSFDRQAAIMDVRSQPGIGSATLKLISGSPPENILLRLHLSGLEEFRLSYNQTVIKASISSSSHATIQSLISAEGREQPITLLSPLWLDIHIVSDQPAIQFPLESGYFEIALPAGLLKDTGGFSINWIDFYR